MPGDPSARCFKGIVTFAPLAGDIGTCPARLGGLAAHPSGTFPALPLRCLPAFAVEFLAQQRVINLFPCVIAPSLALGWKGLLDAIGKALAHLVGTASGGPLPPVDRLAELNLLIDQRLADLAAVLLAPVRELLLDGVQGNLLALGLIAARLVRGI